MIHRIVVATAFLLLITSGFAQKQDFQTWYSVSLDAKLLHTLNINVSPELRMTRNSSDLKSYLVDFDLSYPLNKYFRIGTQYRFEQKYYYNEISYLVNRPGVYARVDYDIWRFRMAYRAVYEWEYTGYNTREYGNIPLQEMRHKISVGYYKKKWDLRPEISYEIYVPLRPEFVQLSRKYRACAGLTYKINKHMDVSLDYKYQHEFYAKDPLTAHIIAFNFSYSL